MSINPRKKLSASSVRALVLERKRCFGRLSRIRLNDGESALLGYSKCGSLSKRDYFLNRWWGTTEIRGEDLLRLREEIFAAARNSDILGIPAHDHGTREDMRNVYKIVEENHLYNDDTRLTSALISIHLFERGVIAEVVRDEHRIGLITATDNLPDTIAAECHVEEITTVLLPGQHSVFHQERHFPDHHDRIKGEIQVTHPGMVFLIGAGPPGKVYADIVRRGGGIALDVGSVLDCWSGRMTRDYHHLWRGVGVAGH